MDKIGIPAETISRFIAALPEPSEQLDGHTITFPYMASDGYRRVSFVCAQDFSRFEPKRFQWNLILKVGKSRSKVAAGRMEQIADSKNNGK